MSLSCSLGEIPHYLETTQSIGWFNLTLISNNKKDKQLCGNVGHQECLRI